MNKILLLENLFFLKKKYLKYLSIILLCPMVMYAMNVLIFTSFYSHDSIQIWSSVGIWISCPVLCSYIYSHDIISNTKKANFIFNSYLSFVNILISILLMSFFIALLSFLASYFVIYGLVGTSVSFSHFFYLIITVFSIVSLFIPIGIFLGFYDNNNIGAATVMLICCCMVQFSYFLNSELQYSYNPIFDVLRNCASFILHSSNHTFNFKPIIIMFSISIPTSSIIIYVITKLINKKYER